MPKISASTALSRLRILDLSRVRAGPTCVKQFADFGADVIKIESPPGVDPNEAMGGPPGQWRGGPGAGTADMAAALSAPLGVMTALLDGEASGRGQWVQSSLLQAGIALLDFQAARSLMKGEVPPQVGNDHPTSMPTSAYKTADGYINVAASGEGDRKSTRLNSSHLVNSYAVF